jgi:hypothetical protein
MDCCQAFVPDSGANQTEASWVGCCGFAQGGESFGELIARPQDLTLKTLWLEMLKCDTNLPSSLMFEAPAGVSFA